MRPRRVVRQYEELAALKAEAGVLFGNPAQIEVYELGDKQRISKLGAWAMITRALPPIEGGIDRHMRVGRLFYIEHTADANDNGFRPNGTYKVISHTPWGDVCLWPYEYSAFSTADVIELWTSGDVVFHPVNIDGARFSEIAFYARSRGIGLGDAAVMALGTLSGPVGWFEPATPELAQACEEMAARVHRPWRRIRRCPPTLRAARKRGEETMSTPSTDERSAILEAFIAKTPGAALEDLRTHRDWHNEDDSKRGAFYVDWEDPDSEPWRVRQYRVTRGAGGGYSFEEIR